VKMENKNYSMIVRGIIKDDDFIFSTVREMVKDESLTPEVLERIKFCPCLLESYDGETLIEAALMAGNFKIIPALVAFSDSIDFELYDRIFNTISFTEPDVLSEDVKNKILNTLEASKDKVTKPKERVKKRELVLA